MVGAGVISPAISGKAKASSGGKSESTLAPSDTMGEKLRAAGMPGKILAIFLFAFGFSNFYSNSSDSSDDDEDAQLSKESGSDDASEPSKESSENSGSEEASKDTDSESELSDFSMSCKLWVKEKGCEDGYEPNLENEKKKRRNQRHLLPAYQVLRLGQELLQRNIGAQP